LFAEKGLTSADGMDKREHDENPGSQR